VDQSSPNQRRGAQIATALFAIFAVWFIVSTVIQISRYALGQTAG
jgi:hypothetical protein